MEILFEVHNREELEKIELSNKIIGVNNRNLKTFKTDIQTSIELSSFIPDDCIKISESGINKPEDVLKLKKYGYNGFLIGEKFMKTANPGLACKNFINQLRNEN